MSDPRNGQNATKHLSYAVLMSSSCNVIFRQHPVQSTTTEVDTKMNDKNGSLSIRSLRHKLKSFKNMSQQKLLLSKELKLHRMGHPTGLVNTMLAS